MKKYAFITSMNQQYYDHIGRFMLESFLKYAPKHFVLHLYAEGIDSELPRATNLVIYDWNQVCKEDWEKFAAKTDDNSAKKFGKKGWASIHAWENIDADRLIWLDADLLFFKEFDETVIDKTLNKNQLIGLFDQRYQQIQEHETLGKPIEGFSAETGYVILNKNHKDFTNFVKLYRSLYELSSKPNEILRWWDNQICMFAANSFKEHVNDLSLFRTTNKTQTPLNHCFLNEYFSHYKGKSKKSLKTSKFETVTGINNER